MGGVKELGGRGEKMARKRKPAHILTPEKKHRAKKSYDKSTKKSLATTARKRHIEKSHNERDAR